MNTLRERSYEVCNLLCAAMVRHRERRYGEASDPIRRAAAIISDATAEIERRLKALAEQVRASLPPDSPRVLCVDDNPDVADSEAELLRIVGLEVRTCYSGAAALVEAADFRPTLCLLDLNMPGTNWPCGSGSRPAPGH